MNPDQSVLRRRRLRRLQTLCRHISRFTDEFGGESMLVLAHAPVVVPPEDPAKKRKTRNSAKGLVVKFTQANRANIQPACLQEFWKNVERPWARHLHAHDLGRFVKDRKLAVARIGDENTDDDDDDGGNGNDGNDDGDDDDDEDNDDGNEGADNDDEENVFSDGEADLTQEFLAKRIREIHEEAMRTAAGKAKSIFPPIQSKRKRAT